MYMTDDFTIANDKTECICTAISTVATKRIFKLHL